MVQSSVSTTLGAPIAVRLLTLNVIQIVKKALHFRQNLVKMDRSAGLLTRPSELSVDEKGELAGLMPLSTKKLSK